jgi:hypothetical protein
VSISLPARAYKQVAHSATMKITTPARPKSARTCNHEQNVPVCCRAQLARQVVDYSISGVNSITSASARHPSKDDGPRVRRLQHCVGDAHYRRPVECRAVGVKRLATVTPHVRSLSTSATKPSPFQAHVREALLGCMAPPEYGYDIDDAARMLARRVTG